MTSSSKVNLAIFAGELLLRNGAEAYRVEDTISRILKHYNYKNVETVTSITALYVSVIDDNDVATTLIKRIHTRTIDLNKIAEVNSISRQICEDKISPKEAFDKLNEVQQSKTYSDLMLIIGFAVTAFGFSYVLRNSLHDAFATLFVGIISGVFSVKACKNLNRIAYPFILSTFISFSSIIACMFFKSADMNNVIVGGLMPLVPGVAAVNAVRDMLNGDYMCAQARLLDVFLVAMCIAFGVGFSLTLYRYIGGLIWFQQYFCNVSLYFLQQ